MCGGRKVPRRGLVEQWLLAACGKSREAGAEGGANQAGLEQTRRGDYGSHAWPKERTHHTSGPRLVGSWSRCRALAWAPEGTSG
jgi:hypothetical protein